MLGVIQYDEVLIQVIATHHILTEGLRAGVKSTTTRQGTHGEPYGSQTSFYCSSSNHDQYITPTLEFIHAKPYGRFGHGLYLTPPKLNNNNYK